MTNCANSKLSSEDLKINKIRLDLDEKTEFVLFLDGG